MNPNAAKNLQSLAKMFDEYEQQAVINTNLEEKQRMIDELKAQAVYSSLMVRLGVVKI